MPRVLFDNLPYLLEGAASTLALSAACTVLAAGIGLVTALVQVFGHPVLRLPAVCYISLMRGIPLIVLVIAVYYVLPYSGLDLDPVTGGILVVSLYFGAFMSEVFRGALRSVARGQWDAGRALGMHGRCLMIDIVAPQALRIAGPPFVNTCIMLIKGTSIVSVIGLWELTLAGRQVVERTLAAFQVFGGVAAIYFVICFGLSLCVRQLERRVPHAP